MTEDRRKYWRIEHEWRAIRFTLVILGTVVWLLQDGFQYGDLLVLFFFILAGLTEQFHGHLCRLLERKHNWEIQHEDEE